MNRRIIQALDSLKGLVASLNEIKPGPWQRMITFIAIVIFFVLIQSPSPGYYPEWG